MDLVRGICARLGVMTSGITKLIGRWLLAFLRGRLRWGAPIEREPEQDREYPFALLVHYVFGALFALAYAVLIPSVHWSVLSGVLFAQATLPLIWFVLYPGMGMGRFGARLGVARSLFTTIGIHVVYGAVVGAVMSGIPAL